MLGNNCSVFFLNLGPANVDIYVNITLNKAVSLYAKGSLSRRPWVLEIIVVECICFGPGSYLNPRLRPGRSTPECPGYVIREHVR